MTALLLQLILLYFLLFTPILSILTQLFVVGFIVMLRFLLVTWLCKFNSLPYFSSSPTEYFPVLTDRHCFRQINTDLNQVFVSTREKAATFHFTSSIFPAPPKVSLLLHLCTSLTSSSCFSV